MIARGTTITTTTVVSRLDEHTTPPPISAKPIDPRLEEAYSTSACPVTCLRSAGGSIASEFLHCFTMPHAALIWSVRVERW